MASPTAKFDALRRSDMKDDAMILADLYSRAAAPVLRERHPVLDALYKAAAAGESETADGVLDKLYNWGSGGLDYLGNSVLSYLYARAGMGVGNGLATLAKHPFLKGLDNQAKRLFVDGKGWDRHKRLAGRLNGMVPGVTVTDPNETRLKYNVHGYRNKHRPQTGLIDRVKSIFRYNPQGNPSFNPVSGAISLSTNNPAHAAHEVGHAMNNQWLRKTLGTEFGNRVHIGLGRGLRRFGKGLTMGLYTLGGDTVKDYAWIPAAVLALPGLAEEGLASIKGYNRYTKNYRIPPRARGKLGLAKALGTYIVSHGAPLAGLYAAKRLQGYTQNLL